MENFLSGYSSGTQFCTYIGIFLGLSVFYWLFYVPCNWKKKMDDIGYDITLKNARVVGSANKRDYINKMRKLRKINAKELPPPYPNGWYSILESTDLKRGEVKNVCVLGEQLVAFRTLNETVYVLDAYCPHLGANMGIGGKVVGDTIECPFHKWSFRGDDGTCANVPYSKCVPRSVKVRKWLSKELNDNIFIWYNADSDQSPWDIPTIHEIANKEFVYQGRNEYYVNCHIQEIPENGADLGHFEAIHNASILAGSANHHKNTLRTLGTHTWEAVWSPSEAPSKHVAHIKLAHVYVLAQKYRIFPVDIMGEQIGPSLVHLHLKGSLFGRIKILQTITPVGPMEHKVVHRFYAPRIFAPIIKFAIFGESVMFERDVNMWNHKTYRRRPQLVKEDSVINSFRNWYQQFYSENSRSFQDSSARYDW